MKVRKITALLLAFAMLFCLAACGESAKEPEIYRVRFDIGRGTLVSGELEQNVEAGGDAAEPTVERTGYSFAGWNGSFTDITEDTTVSAIWEECYDVTFNAAGGTVISGEETQYLTEGAMPAEPTVERDGFTFAGWDHEVSAVTEDTVYVAQWEANSMDAAQVYEAISGSVVEVRVYDQDGEWTALGSGFFIDTEGMLVTNYHVIDGSYSATVLTYDEQEYDVTGVVDYDPDLDIAILRCTKADTIPLTISDREVHSGDTIYTLGSSLGETNTFSTGIVSNPSRDIDGEEYIQITAPISHGNSGGPLVNEYGEVIGINTMGASDGQNVNFSIHITELDNLNLNAEPETVSEVYLANYPETTEDTTTESQNGTIVSNNNDPGTAVYSAADYIEWEPNDTFAASDTLHNGCWTAGYCTAEDADGYTFTVEEETEVYLLVMCYYDESDDYIMAELFNSDYDAVENLILEQDEDGFWCTTITLQPGTYYIGVVLSDDYPNEIGCYYLIGGIWA